MKPITVLFPYSDQGVVGGSHVSSLGLVKGLDRAEFAPRVICHSHEGAVPDYIRSLGLEFDVIPDAPVMSPSYGKRTGDASLMTYAIKTFPAIRREIKRINPHIIHTNDGRMNVNWGIAARATGRKLVWHHRQGPEGFGINKIAPLLANRILSVSEFSKPTRPIRNIDDRFTVVRSPFEFAEPAPNRAQSRADLLAELSLPKDTFLLAYFGTLNARKRPLEFVRAVAEVIKAQPGCPVHGLIFGKDELETTHFDKQCAAEGRELGIEGQLHMMGHRSPAAQYMSAVDALLVTAHSEPFGRTLIEAMYYGTPVIATRHGGNIEAIEDGVTGFLVDPDPPEAFVEPVLTLIRDPAQYARIAGAAHSYARENYGLDVHVKRVSAVYKELVQ